MDDEIVVEVKKKKNNNAKTKKVARSEKKVSEAQKENKKNFVVQVIITLVLIIVCAFLVFNSSLFNIKTIEVSGNSILSNNIVISLSTLNYDTNIFKFNKRKIMHAIEENAYVEDVKIKRKLPSTVEIEINERVTTFMIQYTDSYVYINNQGYMLEISTDKANVPIIVGFTTDLNNIKVGNRLDIKDLEKMNMIIRLYETAKNVELEEYITKIDISDTKEYKIYMDELGKTILLGDASDLNSKMLELKEILHKTQGKNGIVFLNVDLNTQKAYFRQNID